jgi:prolyl 3-hydroxylase /prolyl 3,4-dihydroxylase
LTLSTNKAIKTLKDTLSSNAFLSIITNITGIALIPHRIDLSAHIYRKGGHLLCHDDDIAESDSVSRRIAFIIYLVDDDWSVEDGGQLQLFDKDERNYPGDVTRSIVPRFNSFAFFEVFPCSYHQVQEVFKRDRVSIR